MTARAHTHTSPVDLFRHGLRLLLDKNIADWADLWADDCTMEFPFAPPGRPRRLDGKPAVAAYMQRYPDHIDLRDFHDVRVHETADPETIVVEIRADARLVESDRALELAYVNVLTVQDGRFTACRDYWNPLSVLEPGADFTGSTR